MAQIRKAKYENPASGLLGMLGGIAGGAFGGPAGAAAGSTVGGVAGNMTGKSPDYGSTGEEGQGGKKSDVTRVNDTAYTRAMDARKEAEAKKTLEDSINSMPELPEPVRQHFEPYVLDAYNQMNGAHAARPQAPKGQW